MHKMDFFFGVKDRCDMHEGKYFSSAMMSNCTRQKSRQIKPIDDLTNGENLKNEFEENFMYFATDANSAYKGEF